MFKHKEGFTTKSSIFKTPKLPKQTAS